jgi:hypothetical protein
MWEAFEQRCKAHECQQRSIVTNKHATAFVQINASIEHFLKGECECATTLAAAAEGVLPATGKPHVFTLLRASPFLNT